jgi:hypothetical protein
VPSSQPIFGGQPPPQPPTPATVVDPDFDPAKLGPPPGAEGEGRAAARAAGFPESIVTNIIGEDGKPLVAWLDDGPRVPMAPPNDPAPGPVVTAQRRSAPQGDPTGKTTEGEGLFLDVGDVEVTKPPAEPLTNGAVLDQDDDLPDDEPADA